MKRELIEYKGLNLINKRYYMYDRSKYASVNLEETYMKDKSLHLTFNYE